MGPQIEIIDYQSTWPDEFAALANKLRAASEAELRIDHIGSTAVPGLASKDVIDVQVTVESLASDAADVAILACSFAAIICKHTRIYHQHETECRHLFPDAIHFHFTSVLRNWHGSNRDRD